MYAKICTAHRENQKIYMYAKIGTKISERNYTKMTKTELFKEAQQIHDNQWKFHRIGRCQAWYTNSCEANNGHRWIILRSYSTIVAVYDHAIDCLFVRDYYSQTTTQHIHKFWREMIRNYGYSVLIPLHTRTDRKIVITPTPNGDMKLDHISEYKEWYCVDDYSHVIDSYMYR